MLTPIIARRVQPVLVKGGGLAAAGAGFALLTQVEGDSALALLVRASVVFSAGLAPAFTLATGLIVGTDPRRSAAAPSRLPTRTVCGSPPRASFAH